VTIQDLKPNPQDTSAFYLENIYQLLADTNGSPASLPSNVLKPPPFSPPRYAIWVNSLWFSSLAISLTSALLATLLQQWARRYVKVTRPQSRCTAQDRARVRAFFSERTLKRLHLLWATDAVPALLHLSLLLFFAGLLILLRNTNHTVFNAVVGWVALATTVYAYITLLPIFRSYSPYYGPFSSIGWQVFANIRRLICYEYWHKTPERLLARVERIAKGKALHEAQDCQDVDIVKQAVDALQDDHVKEQFFGVIPDFYNSKAGERIRCHPEGLFSHEFMRSLNEFLDRTLSLDSISESVRNSRLSICLNAANIGLDPSASSQITRRIILNENWYEDPPSAKTWYILRRWAKSDNKHMVASGRCIIARIIAKAWKHDETWMDLAMDQLGVSGDVLRAYLAHGNNILLANLINITRLFFENRFPYLDVLRSVSEFSVQDVLPDLQHKFCTLWNEIVQDAQSQPLHNDAQSQPLHSDSAFILEEIHAIYDALHPSGATGSTIEDNDRPSSTPNHPLCTDPDHLTFHHPTSTNSATVTSRTQAVPYRDTLLAARRSISHHSATTVISSPIPSDTP